MLTFRKYLILSFLLSLFSCLEIIDSEYENRQSPGVNDAILRGWIPEWIPNSSYSIKESHFIDGPYSILLLKFKPDFNWQPPNICQKINDKKRIILPRTKKDWWQLEP